MKKIFIFSLFVIGFFQLHSQNSNLVFFSEQGEHFTVVLNGVQQNEEGQTNVKVTDIIGNTIKLKIQFTESSIPPIDKTIYFNPGMETSYNIKKNNKGEYVLRMFSEAPLAEVSAPVKDQVVIVYGTPAITPQPVATQTTVTQTKVSQPVATDGISMGVSVTDPVSGTNINMSMNTGSGATSTSSYSQTTTTTTTTTTNASYSEPQPVQPDHYVMNGYSGPIGCPWPMDQNSFMQAKASIQSKSFDESKLTIAKQVLASNCMLSNQVKELMMLFSFEDSRLDFAKFAYGRTYDIGNFFVLNDAFDFESSIDELNEYINGYHW